MWEGEGGRGRRNGGQGVVKEIENRCRKKKKNEGTRKGRVKKVMLGKRIKKRKG